MPRLAPVTKATRRLSVMGTGRYCLVSSPCPAPPFPRASRPCALTILHSAPPESPWVVRTSKRCRETSGPRWRRWTGSSPTRLAKGCDLVIFPELALNTWGPCPDCADAHQPCEWHRDQAERADGPACRAVVDMADAHGVHVIYGFEETDGDSIFNAANVVAPDGLVGTYRKLFLGIPLETDRFTPGDAVPVFETDLGPIGISICYDFYQGPELSRILARKGARLLVNPTGRGALPRAREHLEQVTLVRAHENLVAAASANRVGASHGPEWAGGSVIAATEFPGFPMTLARAGTSRGADHRRARLHGDRRSGTTCCRGVNGWPGHNVRSAACRRRAVGAHLVANAMRLANFLLRRRARGGAASDWCPRSPCRSTGRRR